MRLNRYRSTLAKRSNFCVSTKARDAILSHRYISSPWKKAIEITRLSCVSALHRLATSVSLSHSSLEPSSRPRAPRTLLQNSSYCDEIHLMPTDRYFSSSVRASQSNKGMARKLQSTLPWNKWIELLTERERIHRCALMRTLVVLHTSSF